MHCETCLEQLPLERSPCLENFYRSLDSMQTECVWNGQCLERHRAVFTILSTKLHLSSAIIGRDSLLAMLCTLFMSAEEEIK